MIVVCSYLNEYCFWNLDCVAVLLLASDPFGFSVTSTAIVSFPLEREDWEVALFVEPLLTDLRSSSCWSIFLACSPCLSNSLHDLDSSKPILIKMSVNRLYLQVSTRVSCVILCRYHTESSRNCSMKVLVVLSSLCFVASKEGTYTSVSSSNSIQMYKYLE